MRHWIRSRLTYANVMVTILALVVLGGGTAVAAYVVSSNGQIGRGTISGHRPPVGKHVNIIAGSLNGQDVADNSLSGADIDESSLLVSRVLARPTGGTLSTDGLTTAGQTSYSLPNATFAQRPNEIIEFVSQIKTTLATPPGSANTICQVRVELSLDGKPLGGQSSRGTISDQPQTSTVATRQTLVVPMTSTSSQHTVTATAHLVDSGSGFADACSGPSQIDSFALDVLGTR